MKFLKYTQEPKNLEDYFFNLKRSESIHDSASENNNLNDSNINNEESRLSSDSYLSMDGNLSINEINLIPQKIKENQILQP